MSSSPTPSSESTTTLTRVPAPGGAHVELLEVEPGGRDDRFQHAVQPPGLRPGFLLGAGGGHRVYS